MSQQAVSADIIPNSAAGIFPPKTEGTKTKAARGYTDKLVTTPIQKLITINVPVVYLGRDEMILMWATIDPFSGPEMAMSEVSAIWAQNS